jgi:uncharacterized protein involved in outer membrane biogenesis
MPLYKRLFLTAVLVFVALGAAAYVTVRKAFPPEKVAEIVRVQGSELLGRTVGVEGVSVRIFPRIKLAVRGVSLANDSGFSAEPALSLKRLDLSISLWSVLNLVPVIYEIRLIEPDILFEVDATGRNNLQSLGGDTLEVAEDTAAGPLMLPTSLALRAFVIDNGRIRYRDAQSGRTITLGRINQRASLSLDPRLTDVRTTGTLEIAELSVQDAKSGLRKGGVNISVSHDVRADVPGDSLRINSVDIAFQDVKAHIGGSLTRMTSAAPVADIRLSAPAISLASLFAEIPPELSPALGKLKVSGTASFEARLDGVLDSNALKAVRADLAVRDGAFRHADVPQGVEGFALSLAVRGDSVRLDSMTFHSGPNPFRVEALVTGILDSVPYLRSLKTGGEIDLGNLSALAKKMDLLDPAIHISGRQTLRLTASGPLDPANPQRLVADGRAEFIGVRVQVPEFPPLEFRGTAAVNNETIRQQLTARIGKSDAAVNTLVSNWLSLVLPEQAGGRRTAVKVDVRSDLIDLDELLPKTGADADTTEPLTAYPAWPPFDADVTVTLARARLMNLDMTGFSLKTVVREKSAVTDLKGTLYTGGFASTVTIVPRDTTDWGIGFKLKVDKVEANDFISRLNDRVPLRNKMLRSLAGTDSAVFGKFNLNMDLKTHGLPAAFADNLSGPIVFSITDGRIVGVEWTKSLSGSLAKAHSSLGFEQLAFSALKGDLLAEAGNLIVRDFSFDSQRAGSGRAAGIIGFDNALALQLTQALPPAASKLVAGVGGALLGQLERLAPGSGLAGTSLFPMDKDGRALLYYKVDGEVSSPRFSLDTKRMAAEGSGNTVRSTLEDAARRKQAELAARAMEEKAKLEAEARARLDAEKARLQSAAEAEAQRLKEAAAAEKKRLEDKAAEEAKKQGKKVLEGLGK